MSLNRIVALKMILSGQLASDEDIHRFYTEAAANLQHPNIMAIHEAGQHDGQHCFSMAYVESKSLAELIRDNPLPADRSARYMKAIAQAVHYAHQHAVLHRDLKASNVLIDSSAQLHITDLGPAKRLKEDSEPTASGEVLGTPSYTPREQPRGEAKQIGPLAGVYALGATLYETLTGSPPFRAETVLDAIIQVMHSAPVSPRLLNPKIPRDLETICLKCLQKDPRRRYNSANEMAEDLERRLTGRPIQARRTSALEHFWRWRPRRPAVASLAASVVTLLWVIAIGASAAAVWLKHAYRQSNQRLCVSYLAKARAGRWSGRAGRRLDSLEALTGAAKLVPLLGLGEEEVLDLRNEAIGCMVLADLRVAREWESKPPSRTRVVFDAKCERYARCD